MLNGIGVAKVNYINPYITNMSQFASETKV